MCVCVGGGGGGRWWVNLGMHKLLHAEMRDPDDNSTGQINNKLFSIYSGQLELYVYLYITYY